jgi:acylphosphatase
LIQRRVFVTGRVQGVGFRASTAREALKHDGVRGWVRNLPDGRVEAVFGGEEGQVLALVAWCKHGPSTAAVTALEVIEELFDPGMAPFSQR